MQPWQIILGIIVGLIILTILVVLHELGHALTAIHNGVEVVEFGIGFPPLAKVLGHVGKTKVTLNWLPLGGFCQMKGESDDDKHKGSYGAASLWVKTKILLAGVTMNFVTACIIFAILALFGLPKIMTNQFAIESDNNGTKGIAAVYDVVKGSAAKRAGLKKGDEFVSINGQNIEMSSEVPALTKKYAGQKVTIVVRRKGKEKTLQATLPTKDNGTGILGVSTDQKQSGTIKATWSAPLVGIVDACQFFWLTLKSLVMLVVNVITGAVGIFTGSPTARRELKSASDSVSGPVGILGYIFPSALAGGPLTLLYISGVIALSLAVMNLLPIPGLDGGRLYLTLWYHARHKTLTKEREQEVVGRGMTFLFGLIIVITALDIIRVFITRR